MSDNTAPAPAPAPPKQKYQHVFSDLRGNAEEPSEMDVEIPGWTPPEPEAEEKQPEVKAEPEVEQKKEEPPKEPEGPDPRDLELAEARERLATIENHLLQQRQQAEQEQFQRMQAQLDYELNAGKGKLEQLRADMEKAYVDGDSKKITQITEEITDAKTDLKLKTIQRANLRPVQQQQPRQQPPAPVPPLAVAWVKRNKWFNDTRYQAQRAYVTAVDSMLAQEGMSPHDPRYYDELDKRVGKVFPDLVPGSAKPPPVAPARGSMQAKPRPGTVRITADDQKKMRNFGLDPTNKEHVLAWAKSKAADPDA
jgi:hypothetical protein